MFIASAPGINFINILPLNFSYKSALCSFPLVMFWLCEIFGAKILVQKLSIKCWWKWHLEESISSTFYEQVYASTDPKSAKRQPNHQCLLAFSNLHVEKLLIKSWRNWPLLQGRVCGLLCVFLWEKERECVCESACNGIKENKCKSHTEC